MGKKRKGKSVSNGGGGGGGEMKISAKSQEGGRLKALSDSLEFGVSGGEGKKKKHQCFAWED